MPALLFLCLFHIFLSCGSDPDDQPTYAYISGQIINPTTDHVLIKHKGVVLDTLSLDSQNRFNYKIDSAATGLYVIQHKPENQNIYISPGDSLLLRVNTLAFDESLHFSGKGNEINNFLTEMFLQDEKTSQLLLSFHEFAPGVFLQKADSIKQRRLTDLEAASKKRKFPDDFNDLAREIIAYENHDLKERYSYLINKYYREYSDDFPTGFHDYRKNIDFNFAALQCTPVYKRLLENYLINYSLSWCAKSELDEADCYDLANSENVKTRLKKVGELVNLPVLKKYLLDKIAIRGIVTSKNREEINAILQELETQNLAEEDLNDMKQLGIVQSAYLPGTSLSNVPFLNMAGKIIKMEDLINKPTVFFLWSVYDSTQQEEHKLIKQYRMKYPEINFVGINLDMGEEPAWRVAVKRNNYDTTREVQLATSSIKKDFFTYFLDKILLVNASGEVVWGDIYLTSPEFESALLSFLNQ